MPACHNCGRQTMRTRDWACQWCGYPLLSRAYKKIDKTYKQLQEERFPVSRVSSTESVSDSESAPKSPPTRRPETVPPNSYALNHDNALLAQAEKKSIPPPPPHTAVVVTPPPEPVIIPPPAPAIIVPPPPAPAPQLAWQPVTEPLPEPELAPVALPDLDAIADGASLSVDELDALYKANRLAAHARLTNKTILIKGFVEKVFIRDHIDVRYIVLTGANKKAVWPVRCTFGKESVSQIERLAEGQDVTVRGKYDSYGKNIIFKDCVLSG
jgi:hypothetical protein